MTEKDKKEIIENLEKQERMLQDQLAQVRSMKSKMWYINTTDTATPINIEPGNLDNSK